MYRPLDIPVVTSAQGSGAEEPGRAAGRAGVRPGRLLRGREVDDGQRARAHRGPGDRPGQRGDRPRAAHLVLGAGAGAAGQDGRVGHRHARRAVVRARARGRGPADRPLPGARRRDRGSARAAARTTRAAPECALDAWVAEGHADPARLASLRRLLDARLGSDEPARGGAPERRKWKWTDRGPWRRPPRSPKAGTRHASRPSSRSGTEPSAPAPSLTSPSPAVSR